jgi:hypothetical protein
MASGGYSRATLPGLALLASKGRVFKGSLAAVLHAWLACSLLPFAAPAAAGPAARYPMYRLPQRPLLALLPPHAECLDRASREAMEKALEEEASLSRSFRLTPLPLAAIPDSLVRLTPAALRTVREGHGIGLLLRTEVAPSSGGHVLLAEIVDTRTGKVRASHRRECRRSPGESAPTLAREAVRSLAKSPRLKEFRCGHGMISIPPGVTSMSRGRDGEGGAFCIDRYEYPNEPSGEPVTGKTWHEAAALCAREGKRLCTEPEWELACGGREGWAYPYGEDFAEGACNTGSRIIRLSGTHGGCHSPFGVSDLSGNVYEWTSTPWSASFDEKVVKGGNWDAGAANSSCKARFGHAPGSSSKAIGFRCCLTMEW